MTGLFLETITGGGATMTVNVTNNDVDQVGASSSGYALVNSSGTLQLEGLAGSAVTTLAAAGNTLNGAAVPTGAVFETGLTAGTAQTVAISLP